MQVDPFNDPDGRGLHPESPDTADMMKSFVGGGPFDDDPPDPRLSRKPPTRKFDTGATRDQDETKFDYEGFLSPLALVRFAAYMHEHRIQTDGTVRDSDNWQKGIPLDSYMKSLWRHLMAVWMHHRAVPADAEGWESMEDALCGVLFNAQGYLHEIMNVKQRE